MLLEKPHFCVSKIKIRAEMKTTILSLGPQQSTYVLFNRNFGFKTKHTHHTPQTCQTKSVATLACCL